MGFRATLIGSGLALIMSAAGVPGTAPAMAQGVPVVSRCLAVADSGPSDAGPPVVRASFDVTNAALAETEVRLTRVTHSTFLIESPGGVRLATDFAGVWGPGEPPDVVTMNRAHPTHYTDALDPGIGQVLRGWNREGGYAEHDLRIGDLHVRNVVTNIRDRFGLGTEAFGNSIFIFDVGGLCIGHLGHLQHELTNQQLGQIGQLDVVLAPVDGVWTMDHAGMINVIKDLRPRLVVPMHYFGGDSLGRFLQKLDPAIPVRVSNEPAVVLSQATMPERMEVLVLGAAAGGGGFFPRSP